MKIIGVEDGIYSNYFLKKSYVKKKHSSTKFKLIGSLGVLILIQVSKQESFNDLNKTKSSLKKPS